MRWGALGALLLLAGCQAELGPSGPGMVSREAEALAGRRAAPKLERQFGGTYSDSAIEARLAAIEARLALEPQPESCRWQFSLLASDEVNAFSLPGGLIYVTRGLCARIGEDDAMLAAAVAHEMSHVLRRDGLMPACASVEESFDREAQADAGGAALMRAGGYEPAKLAQLMRLTADVQPAGWAEERAAKLGARVERAVVVARGDAAPAREREPVRTWEGGNVNTWEAERMSACDGNALSM
jgi:predicted Zn-dependent protease